MENNTYQHNQNPWKGLKSYIEGERLYGRSQDIQSLAQYILNNSQTVLYGKSGIGKTSILNAGVFPIARKNGLVPVTIRLEHTSSISYVKQIADAIEKSGLKNKEIVPVVDADNETLWEFMHRQYFVNELNNEEEVQLLLVFDQFEEVFTLQQNEKIRRSFFSELADLLNDVCPFYHNDNLDTDCFDHSEPKVESASAKDLDDFTFQFDVNGDDATAQTHYLNEPTYHIVFSLREDFLPQLERYTSYIPVMKNNRFGLLPLNEEQAADIIMQPISNFVEQNVAEHIIQKVTGRTDFTLDGIPEIEVDAAVLSLYLSRLYEKRTDDDKLTNDLVDTLGDNIIKDYYLDSISDLTPQTIDIIEGRLLTNEGRRNNVSRSDLENEGLDSDLLDVLIEEKKILRQFSYGGDMRIEFIHDILCPIVKQHISDKEIEELKRKSEEIIHQKNRKRNRDVWDARMNVMTPFGRKLIENALEIGNSNELYCDPKFAMDFVIRFSKVNFRQEKELITIDSFEGSASSSVFGDKSLDESMVGYDFWRPDGSSAQTSDGISSLKVAFENKNIKDVMFFGPFMSPLYIIGGFCGIHLEYDSNNRVISKTYLNEEGSPTTTIDNYATVKFSYDSQGNPIAVRYYDVEGKPCCHIQGNHGFNSEFDIDGNEIIRKYVDFQGEPVTLVSGVFGNLLEYSTNSWLMNRLFNINADGHLISDKEGYCGAEYEYDEKNRVVKESYLNIEGEYCHSEKDKYAIIKSEYSEDGRQKSEYYLGLDGLPCSDSDGAYYAICELDVYDRLTSVTEFDNNDQIRSKTIFKLNGEGLIVSLLRFDGDNNLEGGIWYDYNKTRTHVKRYGSLSSDGKKQSENSDPDVFGYDLMLSEEDDLPVISRTIDKNGNFIKGTDGYIGRRYWEDEQGRTILELYYDEAGIPMNDNDGVFGRRIEYLEEGRMFVSFLDKNQNPSPNKEGICFLEKRFNDAEQLLHEFYFDIDNNPCQDEEGVYGRVIEYENDGRTTRIIRVDSDYQPIDGHDGFSIEETEYDELGRIIKKVYKDKDNVVVPDDYGDFITIWTYEDNKFGGVTKKIYSENGQGDLRINRFGYAIAECIEDASGLTLQESYYDTLGKLCKHSTRGFAVSIGEYDEQKRIILDVYLDEKEDPIQRPDGSYGYRYFYQDEKTIQYYLDKDGEIGTCSSLYSIRVFSYDGQGRIAEERFFDKDMHPCKDNMGTYGSLYNYENNELGRVVIITNLNEEGRPYVDNNGDVIIERTYDSQNRIVFERTFDLYNNLSPFYEGVYGIQYVFDDEEHTKETIFVDKSQYPSARSDGRCRFKEWFDENDRGVRICQYDIEGNILPFDDGSFIQEREFVTEHCYWLFVKDQNGELMLNKDGRAVEYREEDESGRNLLVRWFDVNREPITDEQGDFGIAVGYDDNNNSSMITSLDEKGVPHINKEGFCHQRIIRDGNGRDILRIWFDIEMHPIANDKGEFGWEISYPNESTTKKLFASLDKNSRPAPNIIGYVYEEVEYNPNNSIAVRRAYDINHQSTFIDTDGNYGLRYIYTDDSSIIIVDSLDGNGLPFTNNKGYAKEIRTTVDGNTKSVFLDSFGNVVN